MARASRALLGAASLLGLTSAAQIYDTSGGPKAGKINVHLVPHTHDDAGWLKTVDEYYMGQNTSIQRAAVQYILDSVVRMLEENPDRKFVYVEQAFFQRWWRQQGEEIRALTRRLVSNGQLTMINGGWVMHCEATPHYLDMIDQTTLGHRLLMKEFGVSPKIGWQIDPFGHSATQAALLSAEAGFVGLFFGRIDYQDLFLRVNQSKAEFIWRASPSLGPSVQVFTGLTGSYGGNYGPPSGFCWDVGCNDEPIQDDPALENYNVQDRIDQFVAFAQWQAAHTRGEHIMMTMGSDFQYEAAANWYTNMDKLIHYLNKDGRVNAFYSNPEIYVAAKAAENISWPLKTDDFFPYADGPHQFWTGYFTSRPNLKRFVRDSSGFLQISKQIVATGTPLASSAELEPLAEAMGLLQHHDAVAGTEKQHTAFDYAKRLTAGRHRAEVADAKALDALTGSHGTTFSYCMERNISVCEATQRVGDCGTISLVLWNGLAQVRADVVELPVSKSSAKILDSSGTAVASQVVKSLPSVTEYGQPAVGAEWTLIFKPVLPPLGFASYQLQVCGGEEEQESESVPEEPKREAEGEVLENEYLRATFCETGRLCQVTYKGSAGQSDLTVKVDQDWFWYLGSIGNSEAGQASGAYIFRPNQTEAAPVFQGQVGLTVVRGDVADEAIQQFGDRVSQRVRLAKGDRHLEITYTVNGLPIDDGWGKEIVSRFSTDIQNAGACLSDSNGREMQLRQRDFRPTWPLQQTEPVAGNYFPVGTALAIRDSAAQLTVLTDAVQGGTGCVQDGVLELMVDRRLLKDDSRGVGEPLNETEGVTPYVGGGPHGQHYGAPLVVRGKHFFVLTPPAQAAAAWRPLQDRVYLPPAPFFAPGAPELAKVFTSLTAPLPPNVQIVTLEPLEPMVVLLRLAHQFGIGEDAELSQPATVNIESLFRGRTLAGVEEMGLTGNMARSDVLKRRIAWSVDGEHVRYGGGDDAPELRSTVTLGPLQIRTFKLTFQDQQVFV